MGENDGRVLDAGERTLGRDADVINDHATLAITCVIPTFESIDLAARAITSAIMQRDVDLEVVVSDDSRSSVIADFVAALSPLYPALRYLRGPQTGNPVENWNHGLTQGRGSYLILLHHDEFLVDPHYLARAVNFLVENDAIAVRANSSILMSNGRSRFSHAAAVAKFLRSARWTLYCMNWIGSTACVVFKAGSVQLFDERLVQLVDVDFYYRLMAGMRTLTLLPGLAVGSLARHDAQISSRIDGNALGLFEIIALKAAGSRTLSGWQWRIVRAYWLVKNMLSAHRQ